MVVKSWDVVIVGAGIIGLSLARSLRRSGASVLVLDKGEPGREASSAAAGMIAPIEPNSPPVLQQFGLLSAGMYPEFVRDVEDESGRKADLRRNGAIVLDNGETLEQLSSLPGVRRLSGEEVRALEPRLSAQDVRCYFVEEAAVDPRALTAALVQAARHLGVEIAHGEAAAALEISGGRAGGVRTANTTFAAAAVVNCAGAWAGQFGPVNLPVRPIRGQMLALLPAHRNLLRHVVRSGEFYLVPRSDGRVIAGSTLEDAGFDKRTDAATIRRLRQSAAALVPGLGEARMHEDWAGLRPGTPDGLPILGATATAGYFVATGHFRSGILLAPATARVMASVIGGAPPCFDIAPFSAARFDASR